MENHLNAVVLRSINFGESDELVTVFSLENGKEQLLARAVRKPESRLRHALLPFQKLRLRIHGKGNLKQIIGAEIIQTFALPQNQESLMPWYWAVELILRGEAQGQPSTFTFEMLLSLLQVLTDIETKNQAWILGGWISARWLYIHGLLDENHSGNIFEIPKALLAIDPNQAMEELSVKKDAELQRLHFDLTKLASEYAERQWRTTAAWQSLAGEKNE